jgi:hypothetical protein
MGEFIDESRQNRVVASIQQHEESAFISVRSKKHHENNKSKTNKIDHHETELTQEEDNRRTTGKEGGYAAGEDVQSTLKSQSQCSDRLNQTE